MNSVVDVNSVVYKFSVVYKNTVVDKNSVVCKSFVKTVDKNSVIAHFSGVDYFPHVETRYSHFGNFTTELTY